jgi:hypothetical protein
MNDPYTAEAPLCDDTGTVSDLPVTPANAFDPDLTYRRQLNNLRAHAGLQPYEGPAFRCTGSAHLAGQHIRCGRPMHVQSASPAVVVEHHCRGCRCQPAIRLSGSAMPPWGYQIVGVGA